MDHKPKSFVLPVFLSLITVDILSWIILWMGVSVEGWLVLHRMFSSSAGLFLLDACSTPPPPSVITTKNVPRHCQITTWAGAKSPLFGDHGLYIAQHHALWENIRGIPASVRNKERIHMSKWFRKIERIGKDMPCKYKQES